jgi:hypothetical protein
LAQVVRLGCMDTEQKEESLRKLRILLKEYFSEEELLEMKSFLVRIADLLVEAYLDGDLS